MLKFSDETTVYGSMSKLIQVFDAYDLATKEWMNFYKELTACQQLLDGQDMLEDLGVKFHAHYWAGKDHYIKWRMRELLVDIESHVKQQ
jgi:hypothetical protein